MTVVEWIASHLYLVFLGYLLLCAVVSYGITKRKKHCGVRAALSFTGSFLCILSLAYVTLVYAVPYVLQRGSSFGSFFEFTAALAVGVAAIAIVQFFNYYHENAILELVLGILLFAAVILLLRFCANESASLADLAAVYGVKPSILFRVLFGLTV